MLCTEELITFPGFLLAFKALNALSSWRMKGSTGEGMHFIWSDWGIIVDHESAEMARNGDSGVVETWDVLGVNSRDSVSTVSHKSMYALENSVDFFVPVSP